MAPIPKTDVHRVEQASEIPMRIPMKFALLAVATMIAATPAIAGETTGNGTPIDINGRSVCAFSGQNDTPEGAGMDPGGRFQSFGQLVGYWGLLDPEDFDPNADFFQPVPGFACNPNRGEDLHSPHAL
jgi:hypothetical protein